MSDKSAIEWTDASWNPVTGCTKVSAGCDNCYAERFSERFRGVNGHAFENGFDLTLRPDRVEQPLKWARSRMIFVNSMSDLFHKQIPKHFIDSVFETMEKADWHNFQVLTKRSSLMRDYVNDRYGRSKCPQHIWLGVSVEDQAAKIRIKHLQQTKANIRFLSAEPLIADLGRLSLAGLHWVIVGGESGPKSRPMEKAWVEKIQRQCNSKGVAFFFKQWGAWNEHGVPGSKKKNGRLLNNRTWDELPLHL